MKAPPYTITDELLSAVAELSQLMGRYDGWMAPVPEPRLLKRNTVRTVQASTAIEGNTLSEAQVTAVLEGRPVRGEPREILEITNANAAYSCAGEFEPFSCNSFLEAHRVMMTGLAEDAGQFRRGGVGVVQGDKVMHMAPPASRVPGLVADLFAFLSSSKAPHPAIAACLAHYEVEFIHPFSDGNGRMGRLWQHVHLVRHHAVFSHVPAETFIRDHQQDYYARFREADKRGEATPFLEFAVHGLVVSLREFLSELDVSVTTARDRLHYARSQLGCRWFARKEYLGVVPTISTATASRDLDRAVREGTLEIQGKRVRTRYRFR